MKSKVKGFTLIELIVVMAIFSIVLAAATSMMQPVAKIMVYTDMNATGNAQVTNISQYLENSLGTAEYIRTANFVPTDEERIKMVKYFVAQNYSGVLSKQTTMKDSSHDWVNLSGLKYGKGKVHVMVIDNEHGGKISEYIYDVDFEPKASIDATAVSESSGKCKYIEYAVNKAYYDQFTYCVMPGDTATAMSFDFSTFMTDANSGKNSSFLIEAKTNRNGQDYNYSTTATVMLVNTMQSHRRNFRPVGLYYVANKVADENGKAPGTAGYTETWGVVDQADANADAHVTSGAPAQVPVGPAPIEGNVGFGNNASSVYPYRNGGMCFIYSYGAEMSTD